MAYLNDLPNVHSYVAAPGQASFPFSFRLFVKDALVLTVDGEPATYSPTPVGRLQYAIDTDLAAEGGSVLIGAPLAGGERVVLSRVLPVERVSRFAVAGPVPMEAVNQEFDRLVGIAQDLKGLDARVLRVPAGDAGFEMPPSADRANTLLGFGETGEPVLITTGAADIVLQSQRREFTASAGQTDFAFLSSALGGFVSVFLNGVRLTAADFTVADALVTLAAGAAEGDTVAIEGFVRSAGVLPKAVEVETASGRTLEAEIALAGAFAISPLHPDYGAKFDGETDDTASLQAAIDAAAASGRKLVLPRGSALVSAPLDLRGRDVVIEGPGFTQCAITTREPITLLNIVEETDRQFLPLRLSGFSLIGTNSTGTGYDLQHRHRTVFEDMRIAGFNIGGREKDSWLNRRSNISYDTDNIGLHLIGSNHSSQWRGCNFNACSQAHLKIEANGTANDGNDALLFDGCDVEFGQPVAGAHGIVIDNARATFHACYTGEQIHGHAWSIGGSSVVSVEGGIHYFARADASPDGGFLAELRDGTGHVTFRNGARIASHGVGIVRLAYVPNNVAAPYGSAKLLIEEADIYAPTGGDPILGGNCLGVSHTPPAQLIVPTQPRSYRDASSAPVVAALSTPAGFPNARRLTCTTGGAGNMTFVCDVLSGDFETDRPLYFVLVYRSTKPVRVQLDGFVFSLPPASSSIVTAIKVDAVMPGGAVPANLFIYVESPVVDDQLELHGIYLADARYHVSGPSTVRRIGRF